MKQEMQYKEMDLVITRGKEERVPVFYTLENLLANKTRRLRLVGRNATVWGGTRTARPQAKKSIISAYKVQFGNGDIRWVQASYIKASPKKG